MITFRCNVKYQDSDNKLDVINGVTMFMYLQEPVTETDISPLTLFILWVWNGSRYSGLLCMAFSAMIYFLMEVISDVFTS